MTVSRSNPANPIIRSPLVGLCLTEHGSQLNKIHMVDNRAGIVNQITHRAEVIGEVP